MSTIGLAIFLIFFLWGFMPLRALFPYLVLPVIVFGIIFFFLFFIFGYYGGF